MNADQLNAVAKLIGTDNKQVVLGTCIRFLVEEGLTVQEAIDAVLGAGRFEMIKNGIVKHFYGK